jgi:polysaccharide pyruvyl transferase WcaK-like protein
VTPISASPRAAALWPRDIGSFCAARREKRLRDALLDADGAKPLVRPRWNALRLRSWPSSTPTSCSFNGEGMIHERSAHATRLAGALALAARLGRRVGVVNQTVDLREGGDRAAAIACAYRRLDIVEARDAASVAALQGWGVAQARLVPDAAFVAPWPGMDGDSGLEPSSLGLPARYVAVTASSALSRRDLEPFRRICAAASAAFKAPAIAIASAKTDLRLARRLGVPMVTASASLDQAIAAIAGAKALVGGRYHPMILAARAGVPIVGLDGNTFKSSGLLRLLDYPIASVRWDDPAAQGLAIERAALGRATLSPALRANAARLGEAVLSTPLLGSAV